MKKTLTIGIQCLGIKSLQAVLNQAHSFTCTGQRPVDAGFLKSLSSRKLVCQSVHASACVCPCVYMPPTQYVVQLIYIGTWFYVDDQVSTCLTIKKSKHFISFCL